MKNKRKGTKGIMANYILVSIFSFHCINNVNFEIYAI